MTCLVIGGTGLVGQNVLRECRRCDVPAVGTSRTASSDTVECVLDKTVERDVHLLVEEVDPDVIVDTAAFHDVDACETERGRAWSVNAQGTRNVAEAAAAVDARLVFLSSDYVFPGNLEEMPYVESDSVDQ